VANFNDWFIKFSPKTLEDIYGQDVIVKALKQNFKTREFPKSTLFSGNFGSGKTAIAKILIKSLVCKTPNPDGSGCGQCPSCLSVDNETWDRDVVYINAENAGAQDVRDILDKNLFLPPIRDAAKVFFIEEAQSLSAQGVEAFLIATQSPLKNTFFVFTAMEKLKGAKAGALESRCKKWRMKVPLPSEIYLYLAKFSQTMNLTADKDIPVSFWKKGLETLAENSETSFRKAIQLLQQCYDARVFEIDEIKDLFDFNAEEDIGKFLIELSNGQVTSTTLDILMGNEYQDKFNLLLNMLGDAKIYSLFGKIYNDEGENWREAVPRQISKGKYFNLLCNTFLQLDSNTYIKKGTWKLLLSEVIEKIKKPTQHLMEEQSDKKIVARRQVVRNA
jgi:DNA polymerase III gamma/tau subunit